jgi:uncharacterized hydrophobic protein (TIGR00271 family)
MSKLPLLDLYFINDIEQSHENDIFSKINQNGSFSLSFITLLIASSIICTLGLILNNSPVVIGGMIISPIMWALSKISVGISYERRSFLKQGLLLLFISPFIGLVSSYLIATISPIKIISQEISSRTNPTLLDLIIALAAGLIATLAISQPKISESLAGVAIATSLMPPLCAAGIGLALSDFTVFTGSSLLYLTNVLSITFISVITFMIIGIKRNSDPKLYRQSISIIVTLLLIVTIPLYFLLKNYSFKILAFNQIENTLENELKSISSSIEIKQINARFSPDDRNQIIVEAEALLPENITINHQQQENMLRILEENLNKKINLQLKLQRILVVKNRQSMEEEELKNTIRQQLIRELESINQSLTLNTLDYYFNDNGTITLNVLLRIDPNVSLTYNHQKHIENTLSQLINRPIVLNMEAIPLVKLKSQPELENVQIQKTITSMLQSLYPKAEISSIKLTTEPSNPNLITINLEIKKPSNLYMSTEKLKSIKNQLEEEYQKEILLQFNIFESNQFAI